MANQMEGHGEDHRVEEMRCVEEQMVQKEEERQCEGGLREEHQAVGLVVDLRGVHQEEDHAVVLREVHLAVTQGKELVHEATQGPLHPHRW